MLRHQRSVVSDILAETRRFSCERSTQRSGFCAIAHFTAPQKVRASPHADDEKP